MYVGMRLLSFGIVLFIQVNSVFISLRLYSIKCLQEMLVCDEGAGDVLTHGTQGSLLTQGHNLHQGRGVMSMVKSAIWN